jgi:hypothetical protein
MREVWGTARRRRVFVSPDQELHGIQEIEGV